MRNTRRVAGGTLVFLCMCLTSLTAADLVKPFGLQCDSLVQPLGIDNQKPLLSWQLQDPGWDARQTAYRIQVASRPGLLVGGKADVWDSGRVESAQSLHVEYAGPPLQAQTRYYWAVTAWGKDGHAYPRSDASWWETGLLTPANWKAQWIGYEQEEHRRIRESGAEWISNPAASAVNAERATLHDFRLSFDIAKPIARAVLYVTGQDTAAAWINGHSVLTAQPLPRWHQMPWQTYTRKDISTEVKEGSNLVAIEVTHYVVSPSSTPVNTRTPMSACLFIQSKDGSITLLTSNSTAWKAALNASGEWFTFGYDDSGWSHAEVFSNDRNAVGNPWPTGPVMMLRHSFELSKPVVSARLYATALGAYQFHLNGSVVGDQVLSPGWMDFRQHVPYQVYDVTSQLKTGANSIAAYLAPGWYTTPLMWFRQGYNYGDTPPALKAQLRLQHADGSIQWLSTDASWKADVSPMVSAELYDGETFDARLMQPGWDRPGFNDQSWQPVQAIVPVEPHIVAQYFQPIREKKVLTAKALTSPAPGVYIYDFGQNLTGVERAHLKGSSGTDAQFRFAEILNPDGTMYVENLRTAKATDHFIFGKAALVDYQPRFTFHGFRYIEVTGLAGRPALDAVKAVVLHTDAPITTEFHTGNKMVNQLWSNILWGQRSNFVGLPTDCPQRDERLGWTADAQVFWRTAAYNMDLDDFTLKFSSDLRGTQVGTPMYGIFAPGTRSASPGFGAGWSDAGVIIPWTGWLQTADNRIIEQNWAAMEKYLAAILQANPDFLWRKEFGTPFGDWLTPTKTTPEDLLATAYWAYDVSLMRDMAKASGRTQDVERYGALFDNIKAAFIKAYVHPDGFVGTVDAYPSIPPPTIAPVLPTAQSLNTPVETQTGYVLALHMNLLPNELRAAAALKLVKKIEDNHWLLGTGFLGTPYLLEVLSDTGHSDVAYRLLLNTAYPSWGYLIEHGATTTWERWNGDQMRDDPSMNSYNHYAYGAVAEWIYRYAAGVDTLASDPGFHVIDLHPNFDPRLGSLDFSYKSPYGRVTSAWTVNGNQTVWKLTIPPNASGRLHLSATEAEGYTVDGVSVKRSAKVHANGDNGYEVPAGSYSFTIRMSSELPPNGRANNQ